MSPRAVPRSILRLPIGLHVSFPAPLPPARGVVTLVLAALALAAPAAVPAGTFVVRADGTGDYPTIQSALDALAPDDVIELMPGTYTGPGNRDLDPQGKGIVVRSQSGDPASVVLDAEATPSDAHRLFLFRSKETAACVVEGVTLTGGMSPAGSGYGGAIYVIESAPVIRNCVIEGNVATERGGGIAVVGTTGSVDAVSIENCVIRGNAARRGGGVYAHSLGASITDCVITGNQALESGGGLFLGAVTAVSESTVASNFSARGGGIYASASVALKRLILWGNGSSGDGPEAFFAVGASSVITCSVIDLLGMDEHTSVDYTSCVYVDPLLCNPVDYLAAPTTDGTYTIDEVSPALPVASPCGMRIGALPAGCQDVTPIAAATWSSLKSRFGTE